MLRFGAVLTHEDRGTSTVEHLGLLSLIAGLAFGVVSSVSATVEEGSALRCMLAPLLGGYETCGGGDIRSEDGPVGDRTELTPADRARFQRFGFDVPDLEPVQRAWVIVDENRLPELVDLLPGMMPKTAAFDAYVAANGWSLPDAHQVAAAKHFDGSRAESSERPTNMVSELNQQLAPYGANVETVAWNDSLPASVGPLPDPANEEAVKRWLTQGLVVPELDGVPMGTEKRWRDEAHALLTLLMTEGNVPYELAMARAYRLLRTVVQVIGPKGVGSALLVEDGDGIVAIGALHSVETVQETANSRQVRAWDPDVSVVIQNGYFRVDTQRGPRSEFTASQGSYDQHAIPIPDTVPAFIRGMVWRGDEFATTFQHPGSMVAYGFPSNVDQLAEYLVSQPDPSPGEASRASIGPRTELLHPLPWDPVNVPPSLVDSAEEIDRYLRSSSVDLFMPAEESLGAFSGAAGFSPAGNEIVAFIVSSSAERGDRRSKGRPGRPDDERTIRRLRTLRLRAEQVAAQPWSTPGSANLLTQVVDETRFFANEPTLDWRPKQLLDALKLTAADPSRLTATQAQELSLAIASGLRGAERVMETLADQRSSYTRAVPARHVRGISLSD